MTNRTNQTTDLFAKQLLHTLRSEKETITTPEMLQTAYVLSLSKTTKMAQYALNIELKIGSTRPYIIRDIRGFLKAFQKEESFKLNQSFTFNPNMHYFSSKDQTFLDLIQQCYDQERMFGNSNLMKMEQPRSIIIPPSIIDSFLDHLTESDF